MSAPCVCPWKDVTAAAGVCRSTCWLKARWWWLVAGYARVRAFGSEYCVMMYEGATCRLLSCSMSTCSL